MSQNQKAEDEAATLTEKFLSDLARLKCDKETYLGNIQGAIDELHMVEDAVERELRKEDLDGA